MGSTGWERGRVGAGQRVRASDSGTDLGLAGSMLPMFSATVLIMSFYSVFWGFDILGPC